MNSKPETDLPPKRPCSPTTCLTTTSESANSAGSEHVTVKSTVTSLVLGSHETESIATSTLNSSCAYATPLVVSNEDAVTKTAAVNTDATLSIVVFCDK